MFEIKYHPLLEEDLKQLNNSVRIEVFKKIKKIQKSPELGHLLGNKNKMNLTGLRKVYVAKKQVRIVYEIINDVPIAPMPLELKEWLLNNLYAQKLNTTKNTNHNTTPNITIKRDKCINKYSFSDDLCRLIFDKLPDQYWTKYQGQKLKETDRGQPSFLVWTTACRILDKFELWDEYNKIKPNKFKAPNPQIE